jgi:hypothetical protein
MRSGPAQVRPGEGLWRIWLHRARCDALEVVCHGRETNFDFRAGQSTQQEMRVGFFRLTRERVFCFMVCGRRATNHGPTSSLAVLSCLPVIRQESGSLGYSAHLRRSLPRLSNEWMASRSSINRTSSPIWQAILLQEAVRSTCPEKEVISGRWQTGKRVIRRVEERQR